MSKKGKTGRDKIADQHEIWNRWRKDNRPDDPKNFEVNSAEIAWTRDIATALEELQWKRESLGDYEGFEDKIKALAHAVCDMRWDLIQNAAKLLENEQLDRTDERRLVEDAKWLAYNLSRTGEPKLTKSHILEYIEKVHPDIFALIPNSPAGKTKWWKKIEPKTGDIPESRGNEIPLLKRKLANLIKSGINARERGFPELLGPRDRPNWD